MTTPNEELIDALADAYASRLTFSERRKAREALEQALQSQAERIEVLEAACRESLDEVSQRNYDLRKENDTLRAQIAEIEKSEPVFYEFQWTNPGNQPNQPEKMFAWVPVEPPWNGTVQQKVDELLAYRYEDKPTYRVRALFTRPMPADVTELVEALEKLARLGNGEHYGNSDGNMIARNALSKYKGAN